MNRKAKTLTERLDDFPPFMVYALARFPCKKKGRKRPSLAELSEVSGLSVRTLDRIKSKLSWAGMRVCDIDAFCKACSVDIFATGQQRAYLKRTWKSKRPLFHLPPLQRVNLDSRSARWVAMRESKVSAEL